MVRRLILAALLVVGCAVPSSNPEPEATTITVSGARGRVTVIEDQTHDAVCYVYWGYGISCVPDIPR